MNVNIDFYCFYFIVFTLFTGVDSGFSLDFIIFYFILIFSFFMSFLDFVL